MVAITPNMQKLAQKLWARDSSGCDAFLGAIAHPPPENRAVIVMQRVEEVSSLTRPLSAPYAQYEWIRLAGDALTGKSGEHSSGAVYLLDASSVFAASVLEAAKERPMRAVLDMCASPGGKAIFAWRRFAPEMLIANEVIGKRIPALISNFKRCGIAPARIVSRDPSFWSERCARCFDLVLLDAPCSGQSLLLKGEGEPGSFHPATINLNANRQRRIAANSIATVAPGGYLAYMTCTFARDENEAIVEWIAKKFPWMRPVVVPHLFDFQSHLTELPCYRLWPQAGLGAGAFAAIFHADQEGSPGELDWDDLPIAYRLDPEGTR